MYRLWIVQSNHPREALVGAERVATHPSRELPWLFDYRKSVSRNDRASPFAGRVFGKVEVTEELSSFVLLAQSKNVQDTPTGAVWLAAVFCFGRDPRVQLAISESRRSL